MIKPCFCHLKDLILPQMIGGCGNHNCLLWYHICVWIWWSYVCCFWNLIKKTGYIYLLWNFFFFFNNPAESVCWMIWIFFRYNGMEGLHIKVTEFVRDKDCLVCGPGVLIELDTSVTLQKVIFFFSWLLFLLYSF